MAHGRGGVRYGFVFAVLFALIAYASGVKTQDSVAAVLSAEVAADLLAERAAGQFLSCPSLLHGGPVIGDSDSYPQSTEFVKYCLTLDDPTCKNNAKKGFHYKGQTSNRKALCPTAATWFWDINTQTNLEVSKIDGKNSKMVKGTGWNPKHPFYKDFPPFDRIIINNHGVWRCNEISGACYCRDELRDVNKQEGQLIPRLTCAALLTKPFCTFKGPRQFAPCAAVFDDPLDECGVC
jgi:hypothetical protein